ncbi:lysine--tRNA ligase [Natronobacterium gregoryi]|uniref:Lysine--tRNA ligase n=2 Tax=Natronobacterium gregoryi TaxID=44930 RepID=L0AKL5_NATGS|nr:lysine--tRNA ligase [Natronobacterium gregoryi]AFZ73585.1 lysyl-tRNA synthetase, archaeal and spirochete [Natronobacterium gregoryi SP2]ELY68147.1 lysyl-tRNA ligase [Natronobacterium gregoryi SP2]PLK20027.1 lysine--tRNA ligase [Natronobacterium gregoryi SP2]SFJ34936.1 lysyl-tRNA synthetase, class I [Natronobacterium gregoryi]
MTDDTMPSDGTETAISPYTLQRDDIESQHAFWADTVADCIESRDPDEPIVVKGGISPSGVPHLGNVNEIMRGYFVAEALRERGYEVRQVFTADDRDPLRGLPRTLCDLEGNLVDLGEVDAGALGRNLGAPYTDIPDPFGCCDSYGDHFSKIIVDSADAVDVPIDLISNTELYENGELEDVTRFVLEHRDRAREVLSEYQDKVDEDYVPFNPLCKECGKITETVTSVDLEGDEPTVDYECTDMDAGDQTIDGCGHEGTATLREGKMPWRFEWPAQWRELGVDFEPFGKDHAEGSWPSGEDVSRNVFETEPPVPMVYEWFTLDGEPFSSSAGNVILVSDVLELLEPEVLRYFFAKDPSRARDFSIERLDQLVDEFDRLERIYFDEIEADEDEEAFAERVYPLLVDEPRKERIRLPYTFAAVLGMTDDPDLREEIARREGHIPEDAPEWAVEGALARVGRARNWARRTANEFDYELKRTEIPAHDFDEATETALEELADFVAADEDVDSEELQGEIYETAKRHDVDVSEFFAAGYRLFFDEDQGPKLGPFLAKVDREFVVARLRRER